MSYDLYMFRLKEGVNIEQINKTIQSDEYQEKFEELEEQYYEKLEETDEEDDEFDLLKYFSSLFVDTTLDEDDLTKLAAPPCARAFCGCGGELTEEMLEEAEEMFVFSPEDGMLPFSVSYGSNLQEFAQRMIAMVNTKEFRDHNLAIFDPQGEWVLNHENADAILKNSVKESQDFIEERKSALRKEGIDPL